MEDLLQAFIQFLTDLFAALGEFLGGNFAIGDILGGVEDALGGNGDAEGDAE